MTATAWLIALLTFFIRIWFAALLGTHWRDLATAASKWTPLSILLGSLAFVPLPGQPLALLAIEWGLTGAVAWAYAAQPLRFPLYLWQRSFLLHYAVFIMVLILLWSAFFAAPVAGYWLGGGSALAGGLAWRRVWANLKA